MFLYEVKEFKKKHLKQNKGRLTKALGPKTEL